MLEPAGLRFRCHKNGRNCPLEIVYLESTWKGVSIESMYLESSCFFPPLQKAKHFVSPKFWPGLVERMWKPKSTKGATWADLQGWSLNDQGPGPPDPSWISWPWPSHFGVKGKPCYIPSAVRWTVNCSLLSDVYQYGKGLITALCIGDHRGFWCWTHDVGLSWFVQI